MADIPNMIKIVGTHPGARIANIVIVAILALLLPGLNLWLFIASCVSIGQVNGLANTTAGRVVLVPVFHYFILALCIISAVLAFLVCIVQGILAIPPLADRLPKALSLIVSVVCSVLTIVISTTFGLAFLAEIATVEGFEFFKQLGSNIGALTATHASLIIVLIFFLPVVSLLNIVTIIATIVRAFVLYEDSNVVSTGKVLRPAFPAKETEFVTPGTQDYSLDSSV